MSGICSRRWIHACRPLVLLALLPVFLWPAAASGRPVTTAATLVLTLHVTITDSRIVLDRHAMAEDDRRQLGLRPEFQPGHEGHALTTVQAGIGLAVTS